MNPARSANPGRIVRYDALAVEDAGRVQRVSFAPGSLLVRVGSEGAAVLAVGPPGEVDRHPAAGGAERVGLPESVVIPALVNAHTHLDLTHIGPQPLDRTAGFLGFIDRVRGGRATDERGIGASVREGVRLCLAGGTAAVGDIAGAVGGHANLAPYRALARSALMGVSFIEFFGIGKGWEERLRRVGAVIDRARQRGAPDNRGAVGKTLEERALTGREARPPPPGGEGGNGGIRLGLQPHAPYSVSLASYGWAIGEARRRGLPLCTHLAETAEEAQFIAQASGPIRALLERLDVWDESVRAEIGYGRRPVEHLAGVLADAAFDPDLRSPRRLSGPASHRGASGGQPGPSQGLRSGVPERLAAPFLAVHVNQAADEDIKTLARTGPSVAYCPRASAYFGTERHFGPHRYRDMLKAGVNVCLGTDSIINLPGAAADPRTGGISVLDEMRFLFERDGTDPHILLAMGTVNGASALGLGADAFAFRPGSVVSGVLAVGAGTTAPDRPALERVLRSTGAPRWLAGPGASRRAVR